MSTKNDITGDNIQSKVLSKQGRDNWDAIFGKKEEKKSSTWEHYCIAEATLLGVEAGQECNWCGLSEYEFNDEDSNPQLDL